MTSSRQLHLFGDQDGEPPDAEPPSGAATTPITESPPTLHQTTTYVVDAFALLFQIFHAMPEMTSPQGQSVGCVFGFLRDLLFLIDEKKPDYLFVAFDLPGETFRHALYDQYKADRGEMPESLVEQLPNVMRMLAALRVPVLALQSFEADDVIATVSRHVEEAGGECFIVSNDKDCRQLISDRVRMLSIRKNEIYDRQSLDREWGIRPDQVVDFQSLVGDPVDHVPGVPLVGPKIAGQWLRQFETLEGIYANLDAVAGAKRKQNLIEFRDQARNSRELVRLNRNLPLEIPWNAGRPGQYDPQELADLCREFGFRAFSRRFGESDFEESSLPVESSHLVTTLEEWIHHLQDLSQVTRIGIVALGNDPRPRWGKLVGCALVWDDDQVAYLPAELARQAMDHAIPGDSRSLRELLQDPNLLKVGHDLKTTAQLWRNEGVELQGFHFDTMIAAYLLEAGSRNYSLPELARRYLRRDLPIARQLQEGTSGRKGTKLAPTEQAAITVEQVLASWQLAHHLQSEVQQSGLERVLTELELPLVAILTEMEFTGIRVDVPRLQELSKQLHTILLQLEDEIYRHAGSPFNINAPKQLAQILFEELQLPIVKKTKTGPSTDAEVLEQLAQKHELPALILKYRQIAKLRSTYVDALPEMVYPETGRVHTTFHQVVAATGRLSSADPNLQNIPIRTETGNEIRSAFVPGEPGWHLLSADYSQIELRVLAHFSGDEALCRAFLEDADVHTRVASEVFGVPSDSVTSAMRRTAKAVNFGVIYGQSAFGLAKALNIEQDQALAFIEAYFQLYAGMTEFMDQLLEECRREGGVRTISGRRRAISGVREMDKRDWRQRNLPERTAINTVIQGSAADLVKLAMIRVADRFHREERQARMLLQIHDELLFEVPEEQIAETARLVREEMEAAESLRVPLKVDVKSGPNWATCEPLA